MTERTSGPFSTLMGLYRGRCPSYAPNEALTHGPAPFSHEIRVVLRPRVGNP